MNAGLEKLGMRRTPAGAVLVMLLVIDLAMITFHLTMTYLGNPEAETFHLGIDRSYSEFFQYAKYVWAVMMLLLLSVQHRAGIYAAWAVVCTYVLVDDAFMLHENVGRAVLAAFPQGGETAMHMGELGFLAAVCVVLGAVVLIAHRRARPPHSAASSTLTALFAALVFFGIVVDAAHSFVAPGSALDAPLTVLEDGGEMVVLSVVVAFVFALAFCGHEPGQRTPSTREDAAHGVLVGAPR